MGPLPRNAREKTLSPPQYGYLRRNVVGMERVAKPTENVIGQTSELLGTVSLVGDPIISDCRQSELTTAG